VDRVSGGLGVVARSATQRTSNLAATSSGWGVGEDTSARRPPPASFDSARPVCSTHQGALQSGPGTLPSWRSRCRIPEAIAAKRFFSEPLIKLSRADRTRRVGSSGSSPIFWMWPRG
jgi:hypothetical protein